MRLYNKLKQSENYNIIIGAIFWSGVALCVTTMIQFFIGIKSIGLGLKDLTFDYLLWASFGTWFNILVAAFICGFVVLSCRKSKRFIFLVVFLMAILGILGFGFYSIGGHCAIMALVWYWLTKRSDADVVRVSRIIILALIVYGLIKMPIAAFFYMRPLDEVAVVDCIDFIVYYLSGIAFNPEYILAFFLYRETKASGGFNYRTTKVALAVGLVTALFFVYNCMDSILSVSGWTTIDSEGNLTELEEGDWSMWETEEDMKKLEEPDWGEK